MVNTTRQLHSHCNHPTQHLSLNSRFSSCWATGKAHRVSEGGEAIHFSAFIIINVLIQRATFVLLFVFCFFFLLLSLQQVRPVYRKNGELNSYDQPTAGGLSHSGGREHPAASDRRGWISGEEKINKCDRNLKRITSAVSHCNPDVSVAFYLEMYLQKYWRVIADVLFILMCSHTEQWKKLRVGKSRGTGLPAPGIGNSHKTTPCVATY